MALDMAEVRIDTMSAHLEQSRIHYTMLHIPTGLSVKGRSKDGETQDVTKQKLLERLEFEVNYLSMQGA